MAKPTGKTLPKEFSDILKRGDMAEMTAVFDKCLLEARGGSCLRLTIAASKVDPPNYC